jgi:hypothetical protein|tara:strand:+ start:522 stop:962 length:441 start_codon:yes stop_codon:yes gene_type:complete
MLQGNVQQLDYWIMEAAETERRLPPAFRKQKLASWPSYKTDWLAYSDVVYNPSLTKATTVQITRYEKILDLLIDCCNEKDRQLLWSVAHTSAFRQRGPKWTLLAKRYHKDRRTIKMDYLDALIRLHYRIKEKQPKLLYPVNDAVLH